MESLLGGLLDWSNHTGLGGQVVWSGISVRIPDQTAHLDRTYDSISITTKFIYGSCTNLEGYPRTSEPKGHCRGRHNPEGQGLELGTCATRGRYHLKFGPSQPTLPIPLTAAQPYARPPTLCPAEPPGSRAGRLGTRTGQRDAHRSTGIA